MRSNLRGRVRIRGPRPAAAVSVTRHTAHAPGETGRRYTRESGFPPLCWPATRAAWQAPWRICAHPWRAAACQFPALRGKRRSRPRSAASTRFRPGRAVSSFSNSVRIQSRLTAEGPAGRARILTDFKLPGDLFRQTAAISTPACEELLHPLRRLAAVGRAQLHHLRFFFQQRDESPAPVRFRGQKNHRGERRGRSR